MPTVRNPVPWKGGRAGPRHRSVTQTAQRRLGLALAAPAIGYILVFMTFPLIYNLWISVTDANGANLIAGRFTPNNFANYARTLTDPAFWSATRATFVFATISLLAQFIAGLGLALFFRKPFPGNGPIRAILLVAWILPSVVSGTVFRWLFDGDNGVINEVLMGLGLISENVQWLTQGTTAMAAVIMANFWIGVPFNMLLLLAGLTLIDDSLYEAASVDGASRWQQFCRLTLPLMTPVSVSVLLLGVINTYKVFDLIFTMTQGGPVDATTTLPVYTYLKTYSFFQFGDGAAASTLTMILPLALSYFYVRSLGKEES